MARCSDCGAEHDLKRVGGGDRSYCRVCHARHMRLWRSRHAPTPEQRFRGIARSYANVYLRRGKLVRGPCEVCGAAPAQMHHDDYTKPLAVRWLCREHRFQKGR